MNRLVATVSKTVVFAILYVCGSYAAQAGNTVPIRANESADTRHGSVNRVDGISVQSGVVIVAQAAADSRIKNELIASFDLVATIPVRWGEWTVYVEGSTTPLANRVSSVLGSANADAGSALDRDNSGRFQVSELHYSFPWKNGRLVTGLLDTHAFLDFSQVANDETSQFLASPFVNNPTIEFPDYVLGVIYNYKARHDAGFTLVMTSSHGLADNTNASYSQLFDIGESGKGLFLAAETQWKLSGFKFHTGLWSNTADHSYLNGNSGMGINYGAYMSIDWAQGKSLWNLRLGMANRKVSKADTFMSVVMEYPVVNHTLGVGIASTGLSSDGSGINEDNVLQAEMYMRFDITRTFTVTPSIQLIRNSGFDSSGTLFDKNQKLLGVRLNFMF